VVDRCRAQSRWRRVRRERIVNDLESATMLDTIKRESHFQPIWEQLLKTQPDMLS
jgi:hypothetical protein